MVQSNVKCEWFLTLIWRIHTNFSLKIANDSLDNNYQKVLLVSIFVGPKECEMVSDFFQFYEFFTNYFTNLNAAEGFLDNNDQKVLLVSIFLMDQKNVKWWVISSNLMRFNEFSRVLHKLFHNKMGKFLKILLITMINKSRRLAFSLDQNGAK